MNNSQHRIHRQRILIQDIIIILKWPHFFLPSQSQSHLPLIEYKPKNSTVGNGSSPVCQCKFLSVWMYVCVFHWKLLLCSRDLDLFSRCVAVGEIGTSSHDKLINEQTYYPFGPVPRIFRDSRKSASVLQSVAPRRLNGWDMVEMNWKCFFAGLVVFLFLLWIIRVDQEVNDRRDGGFKAEMG